MMLESRIGLNCRAAFMGAAISLDDHIEILYVVWKHVINEALHKAIDHEKVDAVRMSR